MELSFHKYQGTGNDFVVVDNRQLRWEPEVEQVRLICDRKFGVGADGLILIQDHEEHDFEMIYFNSDGSKSLCGNGSRCAIHFVYSLGLIQNETTFLTTDGIHRGTITEDGIGFELFDVTDIRSMGDDIFIDTGSPHYLIFGDAIDQVEVVEEGRKIRYDKRFAPQGTNVNFIEIKSTNEIAVRTYERGVEDETLSCGTGVTAAALGASIHGVRSPVRIGTKGGFLQVDFEKEGDLFRNILLTGPAQPVFTGTFEVRGITNP